MTHHCPTTASLTVRSMLSQLSEHLQSRFICSYFKLSSPNLICWYRYSLLVNASRRSRCFSSNVDLPTPLSSLFTAMWGGELPIECWVCHTSSVRYDILFSLNSASLISNVIGHQSLRFKCWPLLWSHHNHSARRKNRQEHSVVGFCIHRGGLGTGGRSSGNTTGAWTFHPFL